MLAESKFPVWYPYYINWATAILLEITLLVVPIITLKLPDAFDCILMSIQFLRICNLIALPCLYLVLDDICDNDTIGQSLLIDQNTTSYGATAATPNNATSTEQDDEIDVEQQLDDVRLSKRLIKAGNWWNNMRVSVSCSTFFGSHSNNTPTNQSISQHTLM